MVRNLWKEQDGITLSTHEFKPGIYFIDLTKNKHKIASAKFIISK